MMNPIISIIRISTSPTLSKPGMGKAAFYLTNYDKFDTLLITPKPHKNDSLDKNFIKTSRFKEVTFINPTMPQNRKTPKFVLLQIIRTFGILLFSLSSILKIFKEKPQVIHIHSPMYFIIGFWGKIIGAKVFLTIHGTDYDRLLNSKFYRFLISYVNNILCVASTHAKRIQENFPRSTVSVISNGVDIEFFSPKDKLKCNVDNTIVSVGTLRWHKDFETLIKSFALIASENPDWSLKIIGDGPDRDKLKEIILKLKLEDRIFLTGVLDRISLSTELKKAKIFALTSVTEAIPKVLLEAMAAKCACLVTDVGDCKRVLDNAGYIANVKDKDDISSKLNHLINDHEAREKFSHQSYARAADFSWETYCDSHYDLYNKSI